MRTEIRIAAAAVLAAGIIGCSDSTSPSDSAPRVELIGSSAAPTPPAGNVAQCYTSSEGTTISPTCPVIRWNDVVYWVFAYTDGRNSLNVVAYDEDDNILRQSEREGTKQLYLITVNDNAMTVTLFGLSAIPAIVPWADLEIN